MKLIYVVVGELGVEGEEVLDRAYTDQTDAERRVAELPILRDRFWAWHDSQNPRPTSDQQLQWFADNGVGDNMNRHLGNMYRFDIYEVELH